MLVEWHACYAIEHPNEDAVEDEEFDVEHVTENLDDILAQYERNPEDFEDVT